jgi:hypothetical protein
MVLTRAQHAAEEAASLRAVEDMETTIAERVDQAPSAIAKAPSVGDQLASLAQHLLLRTQALAAEHTALQYQQQGQSDAHNAALMAVQALTETSVKNLTEQQRIIVEKLGEALTATHAGLHEQFQRMQMIQDDRGGQIEHFVNDRLDQALQDVQRETNESKLASSVQAKTVHHRLEEVASKVDGELERLTVHVQELVEAKCMAIQDQVRLGQETGQLVHQQVKAATDGAKAATRSALENDIRLACETIRHELMESVNRAEEPLRDSARALVCEITANTEARMQKALTNVQSDLNLQIQRQADTTTALRDQVRKQGVRIRKHGRLHDDGELEAAIAEMVQKEVQQRLNAVQAERTLTSVYAAKQQNDLQIDAAKTSKMIDHSIQSAVNVICKTVKDELRSMAPKAERPKTQQTPMNDDTDTNRDCDATDDDYELERRMQEAWMKTYMNDSSSVLQDAASNTNPEMGSDALLVDQGEASRMQLKPLRGVDDEEKSPSQHEEIAIGLQERSTLEQGDAMLTESIHVQENAQHSPQHSPHHHSQVVRVNLRAVIAEIQLQVAVRAETAARRYLSRKKKSRKK